MKLNNIRSNKPKEVAIAVGTRKISKNSQSTNICWSNNQAHTVTKPTTRLAQTIVTSIAVSSKKILQKKHKLAVCS
jgi:hypothetical protein